MVAPSHLRSLQALEAAVRLGSLKAAAERLAITPAAVGQRIKLLEDFLGVDLLVRGRSGLSATPALAPVLARLGSAFHDLQVVADGLELARGHEIHIAAASDVLDLWLRPRLEAYRREQPNTAFVLRDPGDPSPGQRIVDCEIGFAPAGGRLEGDRLFRDFVVPVCSVEIARRIESGRGRDRLEGFLLLHLDFYGDDAGAPDWPRWLGRHGFRRTGADRGMRFQRIAGVLQAVRADAGLALCGLALPGEGLDDLPLPFTLRAGSWTEGAFAARFRPDALARPQTRHFRAWLNARAAETRAWLEHRVAEAGGPPPGDI